jgi:hypothetical protein
MSQVKDVLKDWKGKNFNELDKDDRAYAIYSNIASVVEFYIKKGHRAESDVAEIFDRLNNKKFAKSLLRVLKTQDNYPLEPATATLIADFLEKKHQELDEELIAQYSEAIDKILKKRIKKLSKKLNLEKDLVKELLVIVAEPEAISNPNFVGIYVIKVLRKLYALSKDNELGLEKIKQVKNLFVELFGEDMLNSIAINILLERKNIITHFNDNQKQVWNLMTNFALKVLEKNDKAELTNHITYYVERRMKDAKREHDAARRIQFAQISEEDFPMLHKVAKKLSKEEEFRKYL